MLLGVGFGLGAFGTGVVMLDLAWDVGSGYDHGVAGLLQADLCGAIMAELV